MVDTTQAIRLDNIEVIPTNKGNNILIHLIANPKPVYNLDVCRCKRMNKNNE